ncbi:MAG: beta-galactosidase [Ignavibacteriae bacterium]|nr:beta-galactosidase [Ignavibacteriota bacterium]
MFKIFIYSVLINLTIMQSKIVSQKKIELNGIWQFKIDSLDVGIKEKWYLENFSETITLPGSMAENDKGNKISLKTNWTGDIVDSSFFKLSQYEKFRDPNNFKIPFWLQPKKHYVGVAWYKREISIPSDWINQDIEIFLERCHWQSTVWIDDILLGSDNSLSTPHKFNVKKLSTGKHFISIRIDNRINEINPGENSHSISDHTQTNWNGIIGEISINKKSVISIEQIKIYSDLTNEEIKIETIIQNETNKPVKCNLRFTIKNTNGALDSEKLAVINSEINLNPLNDTIINKFNFSDVLYLWDEFTPNVYELSAELISENFYDAKNENFGLRKITVDKTQFRINENLTFLRGTLECAIFPKTGYPPTHVKEWERIFKIAKSFGLNHIRFHSWCPPKAAFTAADKIGLYLQIEAASWANQGSAIGDNKPIDEYIYRESKRIINEYGNHPSFCFLLYGNEPAGENQNEYLNKLVSFWKKYDNRRLYAGAAGWPEIEENDFISNFEPRIQLWGAGLNSIINSEPPKSNYNWDNIIQSKSKPIISHEIGQWCVYPNFKEMLKYDGVLFPENFEIFKSFLENNNLFNFADDFLYASGKLQTLCYKADIEAALRTKNMGGFQLLDLHDFPGQGTALVGVLDPFWDEKGYVTADEYSQFCNSTVPLAKFPKFVYSDNEDLVVPIEVAHFGFKPMENITPSWKIFDLQNNEIANGINEKTNIPIGNAINLGNIEYSLNQLNSPAMYRLEVRVDKYINNWNFWVYPNSENTELNGDVKIVQEINDNILTYIENGGKVIITPKKGSIKNDKGGDIAVGFSSIFWNTAWTNKQPPHTLGILCNPNHPMLHEFPTQSYSNYQWWDAMSHSNAIILSELGNNIEPVVRIIDDWFTARSLGLIIEAKIGKGKIILTGIDLLTNSENRLEAKQLLNSMLNYAKSDSFNPTNEIQVNKIRDLFNIR